MLNEDNSSIWTFLDTSHKIHENIKRFDISILVTFSLIVIISMKLGKQIKVVKIEEEFMEENYYIEEISIFLQNEPGRFFELFELLNEYDIYIKALSVVQATDFGLLAVIVNNPEGCATVLKEYGYNITITEVLAVKMLDQKYSLINISKTLAEKNINIEYMYTALVKDLHLMIVRVNDKEKGLRSLQESGFEIIPASTL